MSRSEAPHRVARIIVTMCDELLRAGVTTIDVADLKAQIQRADATPKRSV